MFLLKRREVAARLVEFLKKYRRDVDFDWGLVLDLRKTKTLAPSERSSFGTRSCALGVKAPDKKDKKTIAEIMNLVFCWFKIISTPIFQF
jgi:hypothetical protein